MASGCSLVLLVSLGASLPTFSSPSPLWPAPGETAAGRKDRTSRDGLYRDQPAPAALVTHIWLCFQASSQQGPDAASRLLTVSCSCRQLVPGTGLTLCHLSAGEDVRGPDQEQVLGGRGSLLAGALWAWGETGRRILDVWPGPHSITAFSAQMQGPYGGCFTPHFTLSLV